MNTVTDSGKNVTLNDSLGVTADGIAYRLARELEDLIELAYCAMRQANNDGAEYDVDGELASPRIAVRAYENFARKTKCDVALHACELNRAYDGTCLICLSADEDA